MFFRAPAQYMPIPKKLYGYPGSSEVYTVRFKTLLALRERGLISLILRGRPRASWHWRQK